MRRAALAAIALLTSCDGGEVRAIAADTAVADAAEAATRCSYPDHYDLGHDEDKDGVADDCDLCPLVPDHEQVARINTPGYQGVSPWCKSSSTVVAPHRLFFEPFTTQFLDSARWVSLNANDGAFPNEPPHDERAMGIYDAKPRILVTQPGIAGASTVVVTAILTAHSGPQPMQLAGIIVRYQESTRRFYGCFLTGVDVMLGTIGAEGCSSSGCTVIPVGKRVPKPEYLLPREGRLGMRVSVNAGLADGVVECRLFNPSDPVSALQSFADVAPMSASFAKADWLAAGEVGLFSQNVTARWSGFDVLSSKKP